MVLFLALAYARLERSSSVSSVNFASFVSEFHASSTHDARTMRIAATILTAAATTTTTTATATATVTATAAASNLQSLPPPPPEFDLPPPPFLGCSSSLIFFLPGSKPDPVTGPADPQCRRRWLEFFEEDLSQRETMETEGQYTMVRARGLDEIISMCLKKLVIKSNVLSYILYKSQFRKLLLLVLSIYAVII